MLNKPIIILGATTEISLINTQLLRAGRFSSNITLIKPDYHGRYQLLSSLTNEMKLGGGFDDNNGLDDFEKNQREDMLKFLALHTKGYLPADLVELCSEAGMLAIQQYIINNDVDELDYINGHIQYNNLHTLYITKQHFQQILKKSTPSSMRQYNSIKIPEIKWSDIGGYEAEKKQIKELILQPLNHFQIYKKFHLKPSSGMLLYGPPGCGKTLLAKAIANECQANFISIKGPELLTSYLGQSESNIRQIFNQARNNAPCILFFDEIDAICQKRGNSSNASDNTADRIVSQILIELDQLNEAYLSSTESSLIFIIAATNRPWHLDSALLISNRLEYQMYIGLPNHQARYSILQTCLLQTPLDKNVNETFLQSLAVQTERFSGADLAALCNMTRSMAIKKHIEDQTQQYLTKEMFLYVLTQIRPSVSRPEETKFLFYKLGKYQEIENLLLKQKKKKKKKKMKKNARTRRTRTRKKELQHDRQI